MLRKKSANSQYDAADEVGSSHTTPSLWGARRVVNGGGVRTRYGAPIRPSVVEEMARTANRYVDLLELNEAAGEALRRYTAADWGLVTNGAAAAMLLSTAACLAGGNPVLAARLPMTASDRRLVVTPAGHRSPYSAAVRWAGAELAVISSPAELQSLGERAAMGLFVGLCEDEGACDFATFLQHCRAHGVPVLVDAASEFLTRPERWTRRGADLVAYSGAKRIGGPPGSGVLLGTESLVRAAAFHAAPGIGIGRPAKTTTADIVGLLRAVHEAIEGERPLWSRQDRERCKDQLASIADMLTTIDGVAVEWNEGRENLPVPRLTVRWEPARTGRTGWEVAEALRAGEPPIVLEESWLTSDAVVVDPFCLEPGEERHVAIALARCLAEPARRRDTSPPPSEAPFPTEGEWDLDIEFPIRPSRDLLRLVRAGSRLSGTHRTGGLEGTVIGEICGRRLSLVIAHHTEADGFALSLTGAVTTEGMEGTARVGRLAAERHFMAREDCPAVTFAARRRDLSIGTATPRDRRRRATAPR